jgi:hypothetical protein
VPVALPVALPPVALLPVPLPVRRSGTRAGTATGTQAGTGMPLAVHSRAESSCAASGSVALRGSGCHWQWQWQRPGHCQWHWQPEWPSARLGIGSAASLTVTVPLAVPRYGCQLRLPPPVPAAGRRVNRLGGSGSRPILVPPPVRGRSGALSHTHAKLSVVPR